MDAVQSKIEWKEEARELKDLIPADYNPRALTCQFCHKPINKKGIYKNYSPRYCDSVCYGLSQRGQKINDKQKLALSAGRSIPHSNKGSHWTKEARIKFSQKKKGITLTIEHRVSLSMAKKGRTIEHFNKNWDEIKQKISTSLLGKPQPWNQKENHPNWQGGITPINSKIRNSVAMKNWRRQVFERDNYKCQVCHTQGGRLVADHIKPFSTHPHLRFELNNGRTICKSCDLKSETYGGRVVRIKDEVAVQISAKAQLVGIPAMERSETSSFNERDSYVQ